MTVSALSKLYDVGASSLSNYYINITSDYAKDKIENGWLGLYQDVAKKWRSEEANLWKILNLDEKVIQSWKVFTILSNPKENNMASVVPWTKWKEISVYMKENFSEESRNRVKEVVTDMSPSMECIVKNVFKNAVLTTDRFHVMKNILDDLLAIKSRLKTKIKWEVLKQQKETKSKKEKYIAYRYVNWETKLELVMRLTHQLRKRKKNWNANQRARRNIIACIAEFEEVVKAYEYVLIMRKIYDSNIWKNEAIVQFSRRLKREKKLWKNTPEVENMKRMIENRLDSITNYFRGRNTNWFAEWLNSRIWNLITMCKWFKNMNYTIYRVIKLFG